MHRTWPHWWATQHAPKYGSRDGGLGLERVANSARSGSCATLYTWRPISKRLSEQALPAAAVKVSGVACSYAPARRRHHPPASRQTLGGQAWLVVACRCARQRPRQRLRKLGCLPLVRFWWSPSRCRYGALGRFVSAHDGIGAPLQNMRNGLLGGLLQARWLQFGAIPIFHSPC